MLDHRRPLIARGLGDAELVWLPYALQAHWELATPPVRCELNDADLIAVHYKHWWTFDERVTDRTAFTGGEVIFNNHLDDIFGYTLMILPKKNDVIAYRANEIVTFRPTRLGVTNSVILGYKTES